jgi:hypothetical protein
MWASSGSNQWNLLECDTASNRGTILISKNVWTHIAVTRSGGNTFRSYVNGVLDRTFTVSGAITNSGNPVYNIGRSAYQSGNFYFNGLISGLRVVNGTALTVNVPTAPVANITNTSVLLGFTNAGIVDSAMMNDLITVGSAQISTSVKKYGTGSLSFNGTDSYLTSNPPNQSIYAFGTGNFTIEGWYYFNNVTSEQEIFDFRPSSTQGAYPMAYVWTDSKLYYWVSSANQITSSITLSTGTWYHIAICRSGTSTKMFINGTQSGSTYTDSTNYLVGANRPIFGVSAFQLNVFYNGYMDDLRITNGYARYTSNFTPSTTAFVGQ